jgi:hypothetical protein
LRAIENSLAITIPGDIEASADEIMARSEDPALRRQALRWKLEAIPAYYQTLFHANSLVAAMDTVVLAAQIDDYLTTGPGRDRFGVMQPVALDGARRTRARIAEQMRGMAERLRTTHATRSTHGRASIRSSGRRCRRARQRFR